MSGFTVEPKGAMHSFRSMCAAGALTEAIGITADDRMLSYLPPAHVAERARMQDAKLQVGFHVFFAESLETFPADLKRARPTIFGSVPRLWQKLQSGVFSKMAPGRLALLLKLPIVRGVIRKKVQQGLGLDARAASSPDQRRRQVELRSAVPGARHRAVRFLRHDGELRDQSLRARG